MLNILRSRLNALTSFPKKYLPPIIYDALTLVLASAAVLGALYLSGLGVLMSAGLIGLVGLATEAFSWFRFKQHIWQFVPSYFLKQDNYNFYDQADKNSLTLSQAKYYLARRWFRPGCDFKMGINNPEYKFDTVLHHAARNGRGDLIPILLQYGADPNALNVLDETPLYAAVEAKQANVIKLLNQASDQIHQEFGFSKKTLLHLAVKKVDLASVQALCDLGGDPLKADRFKVTPLDLSVEKGDLKVLSYFIDKVQLKVRDLIRDHYILHKLAENNHVDCIEYVLKFTASEWINEKDEYGRTPRDVAHLYKCERIEQMLAERGGELTISERGFRRLQQRMRSIMEMTAQPSPSSEEKTDEPRSRHTVIPN